MAQRSAASARTFLADGGEMGARIRAFDWSSTPIGRPERWPSSLKTLLDVMLNSGQPMFVAWGAARTMLYNDAYIPIARGRHPDALGKPFEVVWKDVLDIAGPLMEYAFSGRPIHMSDLTLNLRSAQGFFEEAHFSFSFTPVRDPAGEVIGVFCACNDITEQALAYQRLHLLFDLSERIRTLSGSRAIATEAAETLGRHLRAGRVGYAEVDVPAGTYDVRGDWTDGTMPSLVGRRSLGDFGHQLSALLAGRTVRQDDVIDAGVEGAAQRKVCRSALTVPLFKDGMFVAALFVHASTPRHWTPADEALVRDLADRIWEAVGRARSEQRVRESEARLAFLDALAEQTRTTRDPDAVMAVTTRMLARHLGVAHCVYADVDADADRFTVRHDSSRAPGNFVGEHRLSQFGSRVSKATRAGRPVVLQNAQVELADDPDAAAFSALGVSAMIGGPLVKEGRLVALIAVFESQPRHWLASEIGLVCDVVERSRSHIGRDWRG